MTAQVWEWREEVQRTGEAWGREVTLIQAVTGVVSQGQTHSVHHTEVKCRTQAAPHEPSPPGLWLR